MPHSQADPTVLGVRLHPEICVVQLSMGGGQHASLPTHAIPYSLCPPSPPYTVLSPATHPCPLATWVCTPFPLTQLFWVSCTFSVSLSLQRAYPYSMEESRWAGQGRAQSHAAGMVDMGFKSRTLCPEHERDCSSRVAPDSSQSPVHWALACMLHSSTAEDSSGSHRSVPSHFPWPPADLGPSSLV